ncbi:MAG: DUF1489 domain-containing protein [Rhodospirillaceae bacterium]|jgi:hypothetical protein|nr:DUF1489 domain-containing protein [Rhodospirillaceae bacterium]
MAVHLLRMAVRIESIAHLSEIQAERMASTKGKRLFTYTRNVPRRTAELIDGGSIYWVVKRLIRVRQKIVGIEPGTNEEGRKYCAIELDPGHILLEPRQQKAFQGWRYLKPEEAPIDLPPGSTVEIDADMPPEMQAELRELGLI